MMYNFSGRYQMKLLRLLAVALLSSVVLVCIFGCEGSEGPVGAQGTTGDQGTSGDDWVIPVPEDRVFSMAVFNDSIAHNGNTAVMLTSDQTANLDGSTVIMDSIKLPPAIDGVDDGDALWGRPAANIVLDRTVHSKNFIESARIRAAYDKDYFYMMVQWAEVEVSGFVIGEADEFRTWAFVTDTTVVDGDSTFEDEWSRGDQYDDRVSIMWLIEPAWYYDEIEWRESGCNIACHASRPGGLHTEKDTTVIDVWIWGSVISNAVGVAYDGTIRSAPRPNGLQMDMGDQPYLINWQQELGEPQLPLFQHKIDPNYNSPYPLSLWEVTGFDVEADWELGSTIPGVVAAFPTGSSADVLSVGKFDNGIWTVEFRRARNTGFVDDVKF
jgi:hypothetical protein